ncbi:hypothetical protein ACET3Z_033046 [Daucus carota]
MFLIFLLLLATTTTQGCTAPPVNSCPPFTTTIPYPFSASPGCGHPSFPIKCSAPQSSLSINNLSFSLLHFELNSSSLLLTPRPNHKKHTCLPSLSTIPDLPINLSQTPFKISDSSCSRLSHLHQCSPPSLPNCSLCSWECKLIKNPLNLVHNCAPQPHSMSQQDCQPDVLGYLDNFLKMGLEVEWTQNPNQENQAENQDSYFSSCNTCLTNKGTCGYNTTDPEKPFICFRPKPKISQSLLHQQSFPPHKVTILSLSFIFICIFIAITIGTFVFRAKKITSLQNQEDPTTQFLHQHRSASLLPPVFTYDDLEISTNYFDPKRKIGDGGFGSVFLGQLADGHIVAVKHLHKQNSKTKSFCNEILILSSITHPNLVKLHGYCSDPRGLLLVYDYVSNGTLADHLHGVYKKGSLKWIVRVEIALQIALAIEYLHFSVLPPIVHRDVTSTNIFVEKDMRVKVGDFGLSRLLICQENGVMPGNGLNGPGSGCVWTGPQGTPGYLDPDYYQSFRLTEKSDVYSFGVILLELITGMRAVDSRREKSEMALVDLVVPKIQMGLLEDVVDPVLAGDRVAMEGVGAVAELAFRCVAAEKDDRPNAREVVEELKRIRGCSRGIVRLGSSTNVVVPECGPIVV